MLPCISATTDDERWHIEDTVDLLQSSLKLRFVAAGNLIRIKFDFKPLAVHVRGEMFLHSKVQGRALDDGLLSAYACFV